jgi:hypothetical protein
MKFGEPFGSDPAFTLLGWPKVVECVRCGKPSVHLCSSYASADYECRGTPVDPRSAYGPDRCGHVFRLDRDK